MRFILSWARGQVTTPQQVVQPATPVSGTALAVLLTSITIALIVLIVVVYCRTRPTSGNEPANRPPEGQSLLSYGALLIVALGITMATVAFIVAILFFGGVFTESSQVISAIAALFGLIGTLVGTYFGIRACLVINRVRLAEAKSAPPTRTTGISRPSL